MCESVLRRATVCPVYLCADPPFCPPDQIRYRFGSRLFCRVYEDCERATTTTTSSSTSTTESSSSSSFPSEQNVSNVIFSRLAKRLIFAGKQAPAFKESLVLFYLASFGTAL